MRAKSLLCVLCACLLATLAEPLFATDAPPPPDTALTTVVPTKKPVIIDGDLKDWDLSGKIGPVSFDDTMLDNYNATFYAMYDNDALYLAAVVVEPHLPFNTWPNKGVGSWNGDALIIRMTTNPSLKFPPQLPSASRDIWQGDFWYNHLKKNTLMDGAFAIADSKPTPTEDMLKAGVQAVLVPAKDKKGYTLEVKMPWSFLNAAAPRPKPGDAIYLTWQVCISKDTPAEPSRIFEIAVGSTDFRGITGWGKAVFK